ncbi:7-deoxyloganetic acid glucosyltransferase-like [Dorcoceras hygrometricum]|uniref:7-deoxyloganetic acid glucosyltransferase-like n=1 Tax=Dorcoceras hygrometricum TaxID=472368 RepID=A0A2Z7BJD5_9LAMI|nr:7-deoxyloganetic acid glucosyltransferase-like [Dorcoceras hygrometricum]
MHFDTEDIPLGTDTAVEHILLPTIAAPPTTDLSEQFVQLRASVSQLSINQLKTQSSIGNLQNHLLSRIDDLEKASADARTQQDQDLRGHFKSVRQEVQIQKTALSFEVHELILSK